MCTTAIPLSRASSRDQNHQDRAMTNVLAAGIERETQKRGERVGLWWSHGIQGIARGDAWTHDSNK